MICVIHAHPYPGQSRINRALADALRGTKNLDLRSLYDVYPDFDIDVDAEQRALAAAQLVVWMHPVYWYNVPSLLKHWFDKVLTYGWAYGEGGTVLHGKHCLWVPTTGGDEREYTASGLHGQPFDHFTPVIEQTARFCGMEWESPYVIHGANAIDDAKLAAHAQMLQQRLAPWRDNGAAPTGERP